MELTPFEQLLLAVRGGTRLTSGAGGLMNAEANPLGAVGGVGAAAQGVNDISTLAGYGDLIPGLEYLGGPLSVASGVMNQNPFSIVSGLGSMAKVGASALAPASASLGADAGLVAGAAGGLGGSGGAAAGGSALAAGLGTAGAVAGTLAPILAVGAIAFANHQRKEAARIENQTKESMSIRRGAAANMPRLVQAAAVANAIDNIAGLPPAQQKAALERALGDLDTGLVAGQQVQHLINTKGQGGKMSLTKPADTTEAERYYNAMLPDVQLGTLRAQDAAAGFGVDPRVAMGRSDPAALANVMLGTKDWDPYWDNSIDWTKVGPGNLGSTFSQAVQSKRPDLRNTGEWGDLLDDIPDLGLGTAPTAGAIETAGTARQQGAIREREASRARGESPDALAYIAPYLPGGNEALWREYGLDPAQRFAAGGYSTISEGLARKQQERELAMWNRSGG